MGPRVLALVLIAFVAAAFAHPAEAGEKRALLVGVSGYTHLSEDLHLYGPKNDVIVMKKALMARGFAAKNIVILADQVKESAGDPTDANIRAHLAELAQIERKPDDVLVIFLSGHGTRVMDQPGGDESDGFDEVFLPLDFTPVEKTSNEIGVPAANYLRDDDLGGAMVKIVAKGGEIVFIMDSCFSGTGLRGSARPKFAPMFLINEDDTAAAGLGQGETGSALDSLTNLPGRLAAFFASSDDQVSKELPMLRLSTAKDQWISAFTGALDQALKTEEPLSYDDLFLNAVRILKTDPIFGSLQNPERFGNGFNHPVFGDTKAVAQPRNWFVDKGKIQAGRVDGLTEQSVVALYDRAEAADKDAVAHAQIYKIGAVSGELEPVEFPCKGKLQPVCVPAGDRTIVEKPLFARLVMPGVEKKLAISAPMALPGLSDEAVKAELKLASEMAALVGNDEIEIAKPGEAADFLWYVSGNQFRFQPEAIASDTVFGPVVELKDTRDAAVILPALRAALKRGKIIKRLFDLEPTLLAMRRRSAQVTLTLDGNADKCAAESATTEGGDKVCGTIIVDEIVNKGDIAFRPFIFAIDGDWNLHKINPPECTITGSGAGKVERYSTVKLGRPLAYTTKLIKQSKIDNPQANRVRNGLILLALPETNSMGNPCSIYLALQESKGTGIEDALGDLVASDDGDKSRGNEIEDKVVIQLLSWDIALKEGQ